MGLFGIGKNSDKPYRVMHYEGIDGVGINIPCSFIIKDDVMNIKFKSGANVTLPMRRVVKFEAMGFGDFMMKYKSNSGKSVKNEVTSSYLVITYLSKDNEEKLLVLWAANAREIMYFTKLHYEYGSVTGNIEL